MTAPGRTAALRVLLVEDSADDADLILLELRRNDFEVDALHVTDRAATERALSEHEWDLVLTDHAMPGFSATEVLALLEEHGVDAPCIVVSGAIGEEAAVALTKYGAADFVNKNRLFQLAPAVSRALREAGERRARRVAEEALRESDERFRLIAENARDLISMTNPAGRFVYVSPSHEELLGFSQEELLRLSRLELIHPEDREELAQRPELGDFEARYRRRNGGWLWVEGTTSVVTWQGEPHLISIARDISTKKEMTERLKQLAYYDPLTGLPNRTLLDDRLRQALAHTQRTGRQVGVMFMDFDHFKHLNDSLGHEFGDRVLRAVAGRITSTVRQEDTVARIGGDEFVVVLADVGGPQDVARVAQKLLESISRRLVLQGQELRLSASIGITLSGKGRHGPEDLLKQADLAMYRAKESGKGTFQFFTPALDELALERLNLERELRMALDQGQLVLHYQPRVDLRTMRIVGVEALARWQHPKRGLLPPEDFIPLAEETGLIRQLGEQVLHAATRQAGAWNRAGLGPLKVSVNLSVRQLHGSAIVQAVQDALQLSGLPAHLLELEITESVTLERRDETLATLAALKELGVMLSLDDFGTGYSSLTYLKELQVDSLKVDRNFVSDLALEAEEGHDAALLRAVVALGKNLDLELVGEGIENADQLRFLCAVGFDEGQGFLFSEPLPADKVERWMLAGATNGSLVRGAHGRPGRGRAPW